MHTHILSWGTLLCCTGCINLLFPLICSLSLGDFNNLEFDDDDALVPPLDERLLPLPLLPLFFEGKDEMMENTEEEGGVKGGLLEELCLLSEKEKRKGALNSHGPCRNNSLILHVVVYSINIFPLLAWEVLCHTRSREDSSLTINHEAPFIVGPQSVTGVSQLCELHSSATKAQLLIYAPHSLFASYRTRK